MNSRKTHIKIGVDEAGRGPWTGPVVACALAFDSNTPPENTTIASLRDSKKLSATQREILYRELIELSTAGKIYFWVGVVDNYYIDEFGIKQATREAMRRALREIQRKIPQYYEGVSAVIDGNDGFEFAELTKKPLYIVWGDAKVSEISGASIIAKVFRDKLMWDYATLYPNFHFEKNAWYGTKKHREVLTQASDVTGIHRISYKPVRTVLEKKEKVLVHICCGPDATVPLMDLKKDYEVIAYWYDPNIQPVAEYEKRYEAFVQVCKIEGVKYIKWDYDVKNFFKKIKWLEHTPERWEKCRECYDMRLERTAKLAREMGIAKWTSSLNNSPHKDMEKMFALWEKWDRKNYHEFSQDISQEERGQAAEVLGMSVEQYEENISKNISILNPFSLIKEKGAADLQEKLEFLKIAFRKNGWFQRSVDYTNEHNIFRQNYCGCVYSDTFPGTPRAKNAKWGFSG